MSHDLTDEEKLDNVAESSAEATDRNREQSHVSARDHSPLPAGARNRRQVPEIADEADLPKDDVYTFPIKSAVAYAVLLGATIPERTIYDNCQFGRERNTLKCVRLKGELVVGKESLDVFIRERKKCDAMRGTRARSQESASIHEHGHGLEESIVTQPSKAMLKENKELTVRVGQFESDKRELEILNAGNKIVIDKITEEAEKRIVQLTEQSRMIGALETQLRLTAPKETSSALDNEATGDRQSSLNDVNHEDNIQKGDNSESDINISEL